MSLSDHCYSLHLFHLQQLENKSNYNLTILLIFHQSFDLVGPMSWVYRQMSSGMDPKAILKQIIPHETQIPDLDDLTLWKLIINIVCEPPPRTKLDTVNTLGDVVHLMKTCKNIMVLTGAGVGGYLARSR